jgi:hypothetical protein
VRLTDDAMIGVSFKNAHGEMLHTYSCYKRGTDLMKAAYQCLDLVPKGRDEDGLEYPMGQLRRRSPSGAVAMPRSTSASLRRAIRFSAPRSPPGARARAAAVCPLGAATGPSQKQL